MKRDKPEKELEALKELDAVLFNIIYEYLHKYKFMRQKELPSDWVYLASSTDIRRILHKLVELHVDVTRAINERE